MRRRRPSQRALSDPRPVRGLSRGRHGRGLRSSVAGPFLPMLTGRELRFEQHVLDAMAYLRSVDPERLAGVRIDVANMPDSAQHDDGIDRWHIVPPNRIVLFRVPIDRLAKLHCSDPVHYRALIERTVLLAVSDLLDIDPWELVSGDFGED